MQRHHVVLIQWVPLGLAFKHLACSFATPLQDEVVSGTVQVSLAYSAVGTSPLHLSIWVSQDPAFERSGKKCAYGVSGPSVTAAAFLKFSCPVMKGVAYVTVHRELRSYSAGSPGSLQVSEISFGVRKWTVRSRACMAARGHGGVRCCDGCVLSMTELAGTDRPCY